MFNGMNGLEILKNWPRYEDGEPVRFGDEIHVENERPYPNFNIVVDRISFDKAGFIELFDDSNSEVEYRSGERIKRRVWASNELEAKLRSRERKIERLKKQLGYAEAKNAERRAGAKWLKEHGGLCAVRRRVRNADNRLIELCDALDVFVDDAWNDVMAELRKRLMPEGMEWPTVDDKPVVIGERMRSCGIDDCKVVGIDPANSRLILASDNIEEGKATYFADFAEDCHRPAPKVLDADGAEIREGDTVCGTRDMEPMRVVDTDSHECGFKRIKCEKDGSGFWFYCPDELTHKLPVIAADGKPLREGDVLYSIKTGDSVIVESVEPDNPWFAATSGTLHHCGGFTHRAPVLAADGRPLREGETVWHKQTGRAATVKGFDRMLGEPCAVIDFSGIEQRVSGTLLTHERPDSWERLEEDCSMNTGAYARERMGIDVEKVPAKESRRIDMMRDLVRRAKALAGDA